MLRKIIKPTTKSYKINIPKEYINTEVEILPLSDIKNKAINNE